jgi:hypothetical protein
MCDKNMEEEEEEVTDWNCTDDQCRWAVSMALMV